jgi:hypothetical protein
MNYPRFSGLDCLRPFMSISRKASLVLVLFATVVAGCATTQPADYKGLASSSRLVPNPQAAGNVAFLYSAAGSDWPKYTNVILDPITVYRGSDQQFGDTPDADKTALAAYAQEQFAQTLKSKYGIVGTPGATTLRVHVTLTGAETSRTTLATLTKIVPTGLIFNSVQSARDKQGTFTGSVSYAVEIYDSASGQLLRAYVAKQYPAAENIAASWGTLEASEAGIRKGAQALLTQLR